MDIFLRKLWGNLSKVSNLKKKINLLSLLDGERPFWKALSSGMDLVYLSILWLFCCLPVVTIGASSAALYDAVVHCCRRGEEGVLDRFFSTFRRELKRCILLWLPGIALIAVWCGSALFVLSTGDGAMPTLLLANLIVTGILLWGALLWLFPSESRFTLSFGDCWRLALKLAFSHFPATLLLLAVNAAAVLACLTWLFPLLLLPGLCCFLNSLFIEKAFQPLISSVDPT